jgi:hypothetical protein
MSTDAAEKLSELIEKQREKLDRMKEQQATMLKYRDEWKLRELSRRDMEKKLAEPHSAFEASQIGDKIKENNQEIEKIASHCYKEYRVRDIKAVSNAIDNFKPQIQKAEQTLNRLETMEKAISKGGQEGQEGQEGQHHQRPFTRRDVIDAALRGGGGEPTLDKDPEHER